MTEKQRITLSITGLRTKIYFLKDDLQRLQVGEGLDTMSSVSFRFISHRIGFSKAAVRIELIKDLQKEIYSSELQIEILNIWKQGSN